MFRPPLTNNNDLTTSLRDLTNDIQLHPDYVNPVASGGFSDIYRAKLGDIDVAVKRLRHVFSTDPLAAKRKLMREMKVWSQLEHKNLLPFYGYCISFPSSETQHDHQHPQWCFVSPWMKHGEARTYLFLNPDIDRLQTVSRVASGLYYLHELRIVHGDIKGANILINHLGNPFLCDFGLSKFIESHTATFDGSLTNTLRGSPRWMAYELLEPSSSLIDEDALCTPTFQTDIWSFACTAIELMTVTRPYDAINSDVAVLSAILKKQLPFIPPRTSPAHPSQPVIVPIMRSVAPHNFGEVDKWEGLWELCMECWELDPSDRPTMEDVLDRLKVIQSHGFRDPGHLDPGSAGLGARKRSRSPETHPGTRVDSSPSPSPEPDIVPKSPRLYSQDNPGYEPPYRARKRLSFARDDSEKMNFLSGSQSNSSSGSSTPIGRKSRPSRLSNSFAQCDNADDNRHVSSPTSRVSSHPHPYARHRAASSQSSPLSSTPLDRSPSSHHRPLHPHSTRHRKQASASSGSTSSGGIGHPYATSAPASLSATRVSSYTSVPDTALQFPVTAASHTSSPPAGSSGDSDHSIEAHPLSESEIPITDAHSSYKYAGPLYRHPTFPPSPQFPNQSFLHQIQSMESSNLVNIHQASSYAANSRDINRQHSVSASESDSVPTPIEMHCPMIDPRTEYLVRDIPYPHPQPFGDGNELGTAEYERLENELLLLGKDPSPTSPTNKNTVDSRRMTERKVSENIDIRAEHFEKFPGMDEFLQYKREESKSPNHSPPFTGARNAGSAFDLRRNRRSLSPATPVDHWTNSPASLSIKAPLPNDTPSLSPHLTLVEHYDVSPQPSSALSPSSADYHADPPEWENDTPEEPPDSYKTNIHDDFDDETDVEYDGGHDGDDFQLNSVIPLGSDDEDNFPDDGTPLFGGGGLMGGWTGAEEDEQDGPSTPRARMTRMATSPEGLGLRI